MGDDRTIVFEMTWDESACAFGAFMSAAGSLDPDHPDRPTLTAMAERLYKESRPFHPKEVR